MIDKIPPQYSQIAGKSFEQLRDELKAVKNSHYNSAEDETFDEMVELFAEDDFYNLHYVAKAFRAIQSKEQ